MRAAGDRLGLLVTPASSLHRQVEHYACWAADNDMFSGKTDEDAWWSWLSDLNPAGCLFATAPDVVADWTASWERSRPWLARIRALGFPAALVAQDGMTPTDVADTAPEWDVLFIGGSTEWKESQTVVRIIEAAQLLGKRVHVGRVNSWRRFAHFSALGVDTCDGTYLAKSPDVLLPKLLAWVSRQDTHPVLFASHSGDTGSVAPDLGVDGLALGGPATGSPQEPPTSSGEVSTRG